MKKDDKIVIYTEGVHEYNRRKILKSSYDYRAMRIQVLTALY